MKTNNFISTTGQFITTNSATLSQVAIGGSALLLASSPLVSPNPMNYWLLATIGVLLFTFSLTGINEWKHRLKNLFSQRTETAPKGNLEASKPVTVTRFANQNAANNQPVRTAV